MHLGAIALLVRDYDEAIAYFTDCLGFTLIEDVPQGGGKRWVIVAPPGSSETRLLLAKAVDARQSQAVGNQSGGRVFLFLETRDFQATYEAMRTKGVRFCEAPREEAYATVVVFEDLYGNRWDLLQPRR
ncbi:VOC family protein [Frateuria edaphi]|jgi:catechol 2,3-dioxygenase-like lactoylglutathione lyase family enzyme|uniref:VOC family protein n=1 Tax=Frateuria edaphi TaxID=2898793 RepID=UPI001E659DC9|nr:VOC family protein [Frateuria edaphi]UGB44845.1 VOC family protein [Frateuria edaphi]